VQRQSNAAEPIPPFFLKTLTSLEDSLNAALAKEKEAKKKMNAVNARALNSMKQKVKKSMKEYEKEMSRYQAVRNTFKYPVLPPTSLQDPEGFEREYTLHSQPVEAASARATKKPKKLADSGSEEENSLAEDHFTTVGKGGKAMQFTADAIFKTLKIVHEARGKKVCGVWLLFTL